MAKVCIGRFFVFLNGEGEGVIAPGCVVRVRTHVERSWRPGKAGTSLLAKTIFPSPSRPLVKGRDTQSSVVWTVKVRKYSGRAIERKSLLVEDIAVKVECPRPVTDSEPPSGAGEERDREGRACLRMVIHSSVGKRAAKEDSDEEHEHKFSELDGGEIALLNKIKRL